MDKPRSVESVVSKMKDWAFEIAMFFITRVAPLLLFLGLVPGLALLSVV